MINVCTGLKRWHILFVGHAAFFALLLAPILFAGKMIGDIDAHLFSYPITMFFDSRLFESGIFWNDLNAHGFPMFLTSTQVFQIHLLPFLVIFNAITALNASIWFALTMGAFLFAQLMKKAGCSEAAAWTGGTVYSLSLWTWLAEPSVIGILPILPMLLILIARSKERWISSTITSAAVIAYAWLTLHFHFAVMLICAAGAVSLALSLTPKRDYRPILCLTASLLIGTGIGLLRLLPSLAYGLLSFRTEMSLQFSAHSTIGWQLITRYLIPNVHIPFLGGSSEVLVYIGATGLALVIVALVVLRKQILVRWLAAGYLAIIVMALPHSPLYALLFNIPPFSFLRSPTRWMVLATMILAALVALGFDAVIKDQSKRIRLIVARSMICIALAGLAVSSFATLSPSALHAVRGSLERSFDVQFELFLEDSERAQLAEAQPELRGMTIDFIERIPKRIAAEYGLGRRNVLLPLLALFLTGLLLSGAVWSRIDIKKRRTALLALFIGTTAPVFGSMMEERAVDRAIYENEPETIEAVRSHEPVFSFMPGQALREKLVLPYETTKHDLKKTDRLLLLPNHNLYDSVSSSEYYDRLLSKRMGRLLAAIGSDRSSVDPSEELKHQKESMTDAITILGQRRPILDLLNIRSIVSMWPLETIGLRPRMRTTVTKHDIPVMVYDNPSAKPLAYFANRTEGMETNANAVYSRMLDTEWNGETVFLECHDCTGIETFTTQGTIDVVKSDPVSILVRTESVADQVVIISRSWLPGWRAELDGEQVTPDLAHSVFPAIRLPAGSHDITMEFSYGALLQDSMSLLINSESTIWF